MQQKPAGMREQTYSGALATASDQWSFKKPKKSTTATNEPTRTETATRASAASTTGSPSSSLSH